MSTNFDIRTFSFKFMVGTVAALNTGLYIWGLERYVHDLKNASSSFKPASST